MKLTMQEITELAAAEWGVSTSDLTGYCRERRYTLPRFAAQLVIREHTGASLERIARHFNRDHSTVVYAIERARSFEAEDEIFARHLHRLRMQVKVAEKPMFIRHRPEFVSRRAA